MHLRIAILIFWRTKTRVTPHADTAEHEEDEPDEAQIILGPLVVADLIFRGLVDDATKRLRKSRRRSR